MATVESFSSAAPDSRRKFAYRDERVSRNCPAPVDDPLDPRSFEGSVVRAAIGDLSLAEVRSDAQLVRHSRGHVARTRSSLFFLHLQMDGESMHRQDGREALLRAGDFTLCDSTRQYEIAFGAANRLLVLGVPDGILRRHIACPEGLVAIPMASGSGVCSLLSRFLRSFWFEYQNHMDTPTAARINTPILDLVAAAYADLPQSRSERTSLSTAHRIRIINYIEAHLNDPELTPTRIAEACRMTTRYLHHLFSDQDETVARYILRRRLEACSRALLSPAQRARTVTAIAFDYGFNSPTHFGRVFRARFGATPREYRREKADAA
jgi:AraC-like DNA-binding protein